MATLEISSSERDRIERVLQAAISGSWKEFKPLPDEPFSSEKSMLDQFEDSSNRIRRAGANLEKSTGIELQEDGTRFILTKFNSNDGTSIILTLHSTDDSEFSIISIWNFFQGTGPQIVVQ
ncbi:hypothetical protein [Mesorhizobium sp.]|uniref:hypothetical protein n=1 Tax=Mesorhizobium sp. TaxID=1871066 RepID=UPI000FEA89E9|nr:hypothetical protein [Mesorhizobium sp.]RWE65842.1 MAG: hypothetical protein EOS62_22960 [Mesorhizobium sp.]RWF00968.1 MAG: hypothetical protein EOS43_11250 [Mesorhizobium sp.]TIX00103.1 MAG: hypothetical protein E5V57_24625 [Mesorhizobium sp.]